MTTKALWFAFVVLALTAVFMLGVVVGTVR